MRPCNLLPKYDGATRANLDAYEERMAIYNRDAGRCQACGEAVAFDAFELAHRIANTVANRRRWGASVVDHSLNKAVAHRGACNSQMNIGGRPVECAALATKIRASLATGSTQSTRE